MGPTLASLLKLQAIERDLSHVRRRLQSKENVARAFQTKIDQLRAQQKAVTERLMRQQAQSDQHELERGSREDQITQLRTALNRTKTNKEYSAILTQINTCKADNAKLEDEILKIMEGLEAMKAEQEKTVAQIDAEQKRLDQVSQSNAAEVAKLTGMLDELKANRDQAAGQIEPGVLRMFERLAQARDGEAMAAVELVNSKRNEFTCGGCFMSLAAEHYNALLSKDEIRHCDSCGCILYLEPDAANAR
jgi:uncharacterized protein